jgi:hypothetical protein
MVVQCSKLGLSDASLSSKFECEINKYQNYKISQHHNDQV